MIDDLNLKLLDVHHGRIPLVLLSNVGAVAGVHDRGDGTLNQRHPVLTLHAAADGAGTDARIGHLTCADCAGSWVYVCTPLCADSGTECPHCGSRRTRRPGMA